MRKAAILFFCLAAGCKAKEAPPFPLDARVAEDGSTKHGPVLVTIVVDQLAGWVAKERFPLLPDDGGFARLRREGRYVTDMRYAHAVTDTAPGHAALYTGLPPHDTGIVANETLDADGKRVSFLFDPRTQRVAPGAPKEKSSSLALLYERPNHGEAIRTLADRLQVRRERPLIVSVSLKDRGALFGGGRNPRAAVWLDTQLGRFVTSSAVSPTLPEWAERVGGRAAIEEAMQGTWAPLDEAWTRAHAVVTPHGDGEGDVGGLGTGAVHSLANVDRDKLGAAFRATPKADTVLFNMALAALDTELPNPQNPPPTLLALSLSANDYVGHVFGPNSWEAWDELRRLDAELARFLKELDRRFGADGYSVLLTADHGTTPMREAAALPNARPWCQLDAGAVDPWERSCGPVVRVMPEDMVTSLNKALQKLVPEGAIAAVLDPYIYLSKGAQTLSFDDAMRLQQVLYRTLKKMPGVHQVYATHERLADTATGGAHLAPNAASKRAPTPARNLPPTTASICPSETDESESALVCRSIAPGAPGDFYVVTEPGSYFDANVVVGKGTSHGSPRLYDRSVPLLVRRADGTHAGEVENSPASYKLFSATAAELLQIPSHE